MNARTQAIRFGKLALCVSGSLLLAVAVACSDSDSESGIDMSNVGSLEETCDASCKNQQGCPQDAPYASCYDSCVAFPDGSSAECETAWTRLNHCMARDNLQCDPQGASATSHETCLALVRELPAACF